LSVLLNMNPCSVVLGEATIRRFDGD